MAYRDKEKERAYQKKWWQDNRESQLEKNKVTTKRWYLKNRAMIIDRRREQYRIIRTDVLTHYGDGELVCVQCGFSDIRALSIDHINEGGNQHRKKIGVGTGVWFYTWLKREGYPLGYQTLCMNCQFIKKHWSRV